MLISPLNAFPWVLNGLMEAWVSLKRVQEFIALRDLDMQQYYSSKAGKFHLKYLMLYINQVVRNVYISEKLLCVKDTA